MRIELLDGWADTGRRCVERGDAPVPLTDKEAGLLAYLAEHRGRAVPRTELMTEVWGYHPDVRSRTLDTTVRRLRTKIEPAPARPQLILTAMGVGYRFVAPPLAPTEPPRVTPTLAPRARVPVDSTGLVGRRAEVEEALERLDERGAVWVVGPGGIGKSRLLRSVAHRWSARTGGSAWWVAVDGLREVSAIAERVARELALRLPARGDRAAALGRRLGHMGPQLLVLDGADDLQGAALAAVADWVATSDTLHLAISRRSRPELAHAALRLRPLDADAATTMFLAQLRTRMPAYHPPAESVARLVALLDGLPLALSLAAARVRSIGLDGLRERLGHAPGAVLRDPLDAGHHGALERVLDRSWALTDAGLRDAVAALAPVVGTFDPQLGARLLGDPDDLDRLVDAGWLESRVDQGAARLSMLDCVRDHVQRIVGAEATVRARTRVALGLAAEATGIVDPLFGPSTPESCRWLRERAGDLDAACELADSLPPAARRAVLTAAAYTSDLTGDTQRSLRLRRRLADDLAALLEISDASVAPLDERQAALARAEALACGPRARAAVGLAAGRLRGDDEDRTRSQPDLERALERFEALRDPVGTALAARSLAYCHAWKGAFHEAAAIRRRGLDAVGDQPLLAGLELLMAPYPVLGDQRPTPDPLRAALAHARAAGERRLEARLLTLLAMATLHRGEIDGALEAARAAVDAVAGLDSPTLRAGVLGNAAVVLREVACFDEAGACLSAILDGFPEGAGVEPRLVVDINLAYLEIDQGHLRAARQAVDRAAAAVEGAFQVARVDVVDGIVRRLEGQGAERQWRRCVEVFRERDAAVHLARVLVLLATLGPNDADHLLSESRSVAEAFDLESEQHAAETVWVARGHAAWSTPARDMPPPVRWLSLVRIVRRLMSLE